MRGLSEIKAANDSWAAREAEWTKRREFAEHKAAQVTPPMGTPETKTVRGLDGISRRLTYVDGAVVERATVSDN